MSNTQTETRLSTGPARWQGELKFYQKILAAWNIKHKAEFTVITTYSQTDTAHS